MPPPFRAHRPVRENLVAREIREAREAEVTGWIGELSGRPMPDGEPQQPELVLNRATTLLACICLFRLGLPDETSEGIAVILRPSFPEISFSAHDIEGIFRATCRNRPAWVADMHHYRQLQQFTLRQNMLQLLQSDLLAHMTQRPHSPQGPNHDGRDAIRYLKALVGVEVDDEV